MNNHHIFFLRTRAACIARLLINAVRSFAFLSLAESESRVERLLQMLESAPYEGTRPVELAVCEIMLLNSKPTAAGIEMLVIVNEFFAQAFSTLKAEIDGQERDMEPWMLPLVRRENFKALFYGLLGYGEKDLGEPQIPVEIHILPESLLYSRQVRRIIAERNDDPNLLWCAFNRGARYHQPTGTWQPPNLGYFERQYRTRLDDLRRPAEPSLVRQSLEVPLQVRLTVCA